MFKSEIRFGAVIVFLGAVFTISHFAQKRLLDAESPSNCEYLRHSIDTAIVDTLTTADSKLIFIFRPGTGENSNKIIARRMKTVENHIKLRVPSFDRAILATGSRRNGLPAVEIYVEGKLKWQILAKKGGDLGYDCLEEPY